MLNLAFPMPVCPAPTFSTSPATAVPLSLFPFLLLLHLRHNRSRRPLFRSPRRRVASVKFKRMVQAISLLAAAHFSASTSWRQLTDLDSPRSLLWTTRAISRSQAHIL